jgi:L-ascorbate metabolism protein UlaG (beta-lactamase superfamily)
MKITKYGQSCLVIEKDGKRIVLDPGSFFSAKHKASELGEVAAVFYTHQHADHFDESLIEAFQSTKVEIYGPADLAEHHEGVQAVQPNDELTVGGISIKAVDLPHCAIGPSPRPYNLGYIIDDRLLQPGDSADSAGIEIEIIAVPILGPDISPLDAINQIVATKAKIAIPIHYDMFGADPATFKQWCQWMGAPEVDVRVLADGESVEL